MSRFTTNYEHSLQNYVSVVAEDVVRVRGEGKVDLGVLRMQFKTFCCLRNNIQVFKKQFTARKIIQNKNTNFLLHHFTKY